MLFENIVSLGYNCEVSFRIEDFTGEGIDSYPFSWAYINDSEHFLTCLWELDELLSEEIEVLPWGMFLDKKYQISFHGKGDAKELFNLDGSLNTLIAERRINELKARIRYLIKKFKKLLNSEEKTLFILKIHPQERDGGFFLIKGVLDFLRKNYISQKFMVLAVLEESNRILGEGISELPIGAQLQVRYIRAYANDSETKSGGDIRGWNNALSSVAECRTKKFRQELQIECCRGNIHMENNATIEKYVSEWLEQINVSGAKQQYESFLEKYGAVEVVSALAKMAWDNPEEIIKRIAPTNQTRKSGKPVKNIATFYFRMHNGGIERVMSLLIPVWKSLGYNVFLITEEQPTLNDYALPEDIKRIIFPSTKECKKDNYIARASMWKEMLEKYQIDTVVYNAWDAPILFWDACVIKGLGLNLVSIAHGTFSYLFKQAIETRYTQIETYRMIDKVVVLSNVFKEFWKFFCPAVYIPNPVEICPIEECANLEGNNIVWVGRLSAEKKPEDVLKMMKEVLQLYPDATLTIIGKSEEKEYEDKLFELAAQLGVTDQVCFEGFHKDVSPFYQKASVFVFTSSFEGFSMAVSESRGYGLPVCMYDLPYMELIRDKKGVISVDQGDYKSLANNVVKILNDKAYRKQLGKESRESVEQFANYKIAEAWDSLFKSLSDSLEREEKANTEDEQLMADLLIEQAQLGMKEKDAFMKELIVGSEWNIQHTQDMENYILELKNGIEWLKEHEVEQEKYISELLEKQNQIHSSIEEKQQMIKILQGKNEQLEKEIKELRKRKIWWK